MVLVGPLEPLLGGPIFFFFSFFKLGPLRRGLNLSLTLKHYILDSGSPAWSNCINNSSSFFFYHFYMKIKLSVLITTIKAGVRL